MQLQTKNRILPVSICFSTLQDKILRCWIFFLIASVCFGIFFLETENK